MPPLLAPPKICYIPPPKIVITSNRPNNTKYISVIFSSRPANSTTVVWYKNRVRLLDAANITTTLGALEGNTSLMIPQLIKREDSGFYTVVIENSFNKIPAIMRSSNISFELKVKGMLWLIKCTYKYSIDCDTNFIFIQFFQPHLPI